MGWYLRKSFGFGPLRLNLSKSGLGYSVGVRGARIGVGPRGNYIRLGRGGVYYQKYLSPSTTPASEQPSVTSVVEAPQLGTPVTTAHASEFHDSTSESLLNEIRQKHQKTRIAPLFAIASAIVVLGLLSAKVSRWAVVPLVPVLSLPNRALISPWNLPIQVKRRHSRRAWTPTSADATWWLDSIAISESGDLDNALH